MCERRRRPTGTTTALSTLLGGWPADTIGRSAPRPPTARRVVPATAVEDFEGARGGVLRNSAAPPANSSRTSTASPSTIAAGLRLTGRPGGGRGGEDGSAVVVADDSSMATEPTSATRRRDSRPLPVLPPLPAA